MLNAMIIAIIQRNMFFLVASKLLTSANLGVLERFPDPGIVTAVGLTMKIEITCFDDVLCDLEFGGWCTLRDVSSLVYKS
jgi:hypothetical protein